MNRSIALAFALSLAGSQFIVACGSSDDSNDSGSGGASGGAGASGSGGSDASGGASGASGSGGSNASGGAGATGGSSGSGGSDASGGSGGMVPDDDAPTAVEAAEAMGRGFNLGQMFESTQHPRTFEAAKAKIDAYYAKGFRTVRVPITWTEPIGGTLLVNDPAVGDVNRDEPRLAVIEQVVDYALSLPDMYVVINAHHEKTLKHEIRVSALERLWQDIADIFRARSHRLIFELLNEPHLEDESFSAMPPEDVRAMSALAYAKIRAVDPERIVVIGGNRWFAADEMARVWPTLEGVGNGQDPYVMATFHHYNPWTFCGDNQGDYADNWTTSHIESPMNTMDRWVSTVGGGMPYYIGEWGVGWQSVLPTMDCNNVRMWYTTFNAETAAPRGIPTMVWDDGGWFRIFSHDSNQFENNLVDCIIGECEWSGTERFNAACAP